MEYRIETDTLGKVKVPAKHYWGAQTERSRINFQIGPSASMPKELIYAYAIVKKAAAITNHELGVLGVEKKDLIVTVCDEIIDRKLDAEFPLVIWQTGSGTHTNMNINEVIANRAHVIQGNRLGEGKLLVHPNDDVNMSQSSNDTFQTAMNIAAYKLVKEHAVPAMELLIHTFNIKAKDFKNIAKIGRTHLMDATPLSLGQEFSGYKQQLINSTRAIKSALRAVRELAIGGTAVGTGLNTPNGYNDLVTQNISELTGILFVTAPNKFESIATHDSLVELSGALKRSAVSLMKIGNDIRLLSSGPRCGIGEIKLPKNEPGSSIMPGKINPTQAEALTMVCAQVIGNDMAVSLGGSSGHLELNTFKPLIAANVLQSAQLLGDSCISFNNNCAIGIQPNKQSIKKHLENSLMLITILNTYIGYENTSKIVIKAENENKTLREAALELKLVTEKNFDKWMNKGKFI